MGSHDAAVMAAPGKGLSAWAITPVGQVSLLAFLVVFAAPLFIDYFAAQGLIPAATQLRDLVTWGTLLALLTFHAASWSEPQGQSRLTLLMAFTLVYVLLAVVLAHFSVSPDAAYVHPWMLGYQLESLALWSLLFLIGFYAADQMAVLARVVSAGAVVVVLANLDWAIGSLDLGTVREESLGIYQAIGDCFGGLAIYAAASMRSRAVRLFLYGGLLMVLFTLQSRASLAMGLIAVAVCLWLELRPIGRTALGALLLGGILLLTAQPLEIDPDLAETNRNLFLLANEQTADGSLQARIEGSQVGLATIAEHWLFGDYGSDVRDMGGVPGGYMHSYAELWRQFGLVPFLLFVAVVVATASRLAGSGAGWAPEERRALIGMFTFYVAGAIFARNPAVPHLFLVVGIVAFRTTPTMRSIARGRDGR